MGKYLFFLIFVLCLCATLQTKDTKKKSKQPKNTSEVLWPRTFKGHPVEQTRLSVNWTQTPGSPRSPPRLQLLSNSTAGYLDGPLSTKVIPTVYMLVIAVGVPANVAILSTLAAKVREVSSAIMYSSLAVSDLLLLVSLFFKAHYHLHGNHWVLGEAACRAVTACFYGNLYCSAHTLACISIQRYLAVGHPFMYKRLPKRYYAAWTTFTVWGVFGAAVLPELLVQQSFWIPELGRTTCHDVLPLDLSSHVFLLYYNLFLTLVGLLGPLGVTVLCYGRVMCELQRSHLDWAAYMKASSLVFVIFLVCFTPAGVVRFLHYVQLFVDGTEGSYIFFNVAVCLCCVHACLDPFLFLLMSRSAGSRLYYDASKPTSLSVSS
ncbi:proteinase-activated receptor 3 [Dunckerocampus dactyliophorus]|uniref:proteinase-activated receptor 3 n=1 Tax=Dunckerocampus dactyliophorus TaxID=161453 RepID=UPI00240732D5|nr:proteinase-activated receptor 3 [Dunckerocampus dactyliophorus]XP_054613723.1 proteinase-activated receptor 3 [Dunckerocampus dactyliophorus]XP_054613724.1 proteinase-activated receptor 3 [Dunckerocampus dactyliophorus]XP_054613725.1 proteinase-activated receptor 3 [Dunckerocampus dactyliophorus]